MTSLTPDLFYGDLFLSFFFLFFFLQPVELICVVSISSARSKNMTVMLTLIILDESKYH